MQRSHLPLEPSWCAFPSTCMDFQSRTRPSWVNKEPAANRNRNWSPFESLSCGQLRLPPAAGWFSGQITSQWWRVTGSLENSQLLTDFNCTSHHLWKGGGDDGRMGFSFYGKQFLLSSFLVQMKNVRSYKSFSFWKSLQGNFFLKIQPCWRQRSVDGNIIITTLYHWGF